MFSVAVIMTFVSTLVTPPALKYLFDDASGLRNKEKEIERSTAKLTVELPGAEVAALVSDRMARAFRQEEFFVHRIEGLDLFEMRKDTITVFLQMTGATLEFTTQPDNLQYVRLVVLEEMIALGDVFRAASQLVEMDSLKRSLLASNTGTG